MNDVLVDLRVDDHPAPGPELRRLLGLHDLYFGSSPSDQKVCIDGDVLAELKGMMRRTGHYRGDDMSAWDEATANALDAFIATENLEQRCDIAARTIDAPAIAFLRRSFATGGVRSE